MLPGHGAHFLEHLKPVLLFPYASTTSIIASMKVVKANRVALSPSLPYQRRPAAVRVVAYTAAATGGGGGGGGGSRGAGVPVSTVRAAGGGRRAAGRLAVVGDSTSIVGVRLSPSGRHRLSQPVTSRHGPVCRHLPPTNRELDLMAGRVWI